MACSGLQGDYLCTGWRTRAEAVRQRDGERCRGCNRGADETRLEVHHRRYGAPKNECGGCVLTGVADDDLVTLCADCHDAITSVRRRIRYGDRTVEAVVLEVPTPNRGSIAVRVEIEAEPLSTPAVRAAVPVRRADLW